MVRRRTIYAGLIGLVAMLAVAPVAHAEVRAFAERSTVSVNTPFRVVIEVNGKMTGAPPSLPAVDGLISNSPPSTSTSTQIQIIGGQSSIVHTSQFIYLVQATRAGKMSIPPITIDVDGQPQTTEPILVTITDNPGTIPQASRSVQAPTAHQTPQQQSQENGLSWDEAVFIESSVDKTEVFQGEPLTLTLDLWVVQLRGLRVGSQNGQGIELPQSEGFYVAGQPEETQFQQERNGYVYDVHRFRQTLYPTATGDARIGEWRWEGIGAYGFDRHGYHLSTSPTDIKVKPLPPRPPEFSGAVGSFTLKAQLMQDQVIQGVPTKLVIRVTGHGNPDAIGAPPSPKITNAYVSDPEKDVNLIEEQGGVLVEKTFVYTITPLAAGDLTIPEIAFCYFDPFTGNYKTERADAFTVRVLPSTESTSRTLLSKNEPTEESSAKIDVLSEDIMTISTEAQALRPNRPSPLAAPTLAVLPVLGYLCVLLFVRRNLRFEADPAFARAYHAKAKCQKRLKDVAGSSEPADGLHKALAAFVADQFDVSESGMTSADAQGLLAAHEIPSEITDTFVKILRACERARYASTHLSADEVAALRKGAASVVDRLDTIMKKGRRS